MRPARRIPGKWKLPTQSFRASILGYSATLPSVCITPPTTHIHPTACRDLRHRRVSLHHPPVRYAVVASRGVWRSLVARFVRDEEVVGSNPATPTAKALVRDHIFRLWRSS